ncbi:MAG: hypothetical protein HY821_00030 [Acidobacteria bacterium]|nr:hypothetical protein [Acidobacteriota bacterium]
MPDYTQDLIRLKNPANIKEAECASSPYVLLKTFAADAVIKRMIRAGKQVVPLIRQILADEAEQLPEISLSAYAYILEHVDQAEAARLLKPVFEARLRKPGPFFVHVAAHALRGPLGLPTRPLEVVYNKAELAETLRKLR